VIEVFDSIVSEDARISTLTDLPSTLDHMLANFGGVMKRWATAISLINIVVVPTLLAVVRICDVATLSLKRHQIDKYNSFLLLIGSLFSFLLKNIG
jgi:hypothetical protein